MIIARPVTSVGTKFFIASSLKRSVAAEYERKMKTG